MKGFGFNKKSLCGAVFLIIAVFWFSFVAAASLDELKKIIEEKNEEIQKLEEEAQKFREVIAERQEKGRTLRNEVARIDREIKNITAQIALTEKKIDRAKLEIETFSLEIKEKENAIVRLRAGLASLVQNLFESDQESPLAMLIKYPQLSQYFQQVDYYSFLQKKIINSVGNLRALREELEKKKNGSEKKKGELEDLEDLMNGRKKSQAAIKSERNALLKETKNQEERYQELLREHERRRTLLEDEVREIEAKIKITIDPSSLPVKGSGVLAWPLSDLDKESCWRGGEDAKNCVTQFFGYTSFAAIGAYRGKGHNGVDFRADTGTPVAATEAGTVTATGDTDTGCRKASYGKWILIRHQNNLSTLYAHLSSIGISAGQKVNRGERIGLSGNTGYATGSHLHFSVFASEAVRVESIRSRVCGRLMTLPIAALNGYLDPLDYL